MRLTSTKAPLARLHSRASGSCPGLRSWFRVVGARRQTQIHVHVHLCMQNHHTAEWYVFLAAAAITLTPSLCDHSQKAAAVTAAKMQVMAGASGAVPCRGLEQ